MVFQVTLNQERYLYSELATGVCYALPVSFRLSGVVDVDRLKFAISCLLDKHEMLRCGLYKGKDVPYVNDISEEIDVGLDYKQLKSDDRMAVCDAIEAYFFQRSGYASSDLVKFQLLSLPNNEYVFTFSVHHVVADGVSIGIISRDLSFFYNKGFNADTLLETVPISPLSYKDYSSLLHKTFQVNESKLASFWQEYLIGCPDTNRLLLQSQSDLQSAQSRHGSVEVILRCSTHDKVREMSESFGVSTFSFYYALFHVQLTRMLGASKVASIFQSSGRQKYGEYSNVVGLFSNALVFFTEIDENIFLEDYCKKVFNDLSKVLDHQAYPYHYITRDTGVHPKIGFNWYPIYDSLALNDCLIKPREYVSWRSDLDINVHCVSDDGGLVIKFYFNSEIYNDGTISLLAKNFIGLIDASIKLPDNKIKDLTGNVIEDKSLLSDMSHSKVGTLAYSRIEEGFLTARQFFPNNIAISSENEVLTYDELYHLSVCVQKLIESRVNEQPLTIGIISRREPGLVVAIIGTLLAKSSFAIFDASYPAQRLNECINALEPDLLIGINSAASIFGVDLNKVDELELSANFIFDLFEFENKKNARESGHSEAYWLFTSGTTGVPKCISVGHAPLIHFLTWQSNKYEITEADSFSLLSGLSHDPVLRDIFAPLFKGARLCIPPSEVVFNSKKLAEWVDALEVTVIHMTPQMGQVITEAGKLGGNTVRLCFIGGDRLRYKDVDKLRSGGFKSTTIINVYGASETPQVMGYYEVPEKLNTSVVPIGKGIENVSLFLQSDGGRLVGIGEYGQIVVRTIFMSNGYKADSASNEQVFSTNDQTGEKIYYTGDFGFYDANGNIVFIGRGDDQLKIRGFRVELTDIVAHLEALDDIQQALVLPHGEVDTSKLVCYIQLSSNSCLTKEKIAAQMAMVLPSYMLPSAYILLDNFPLLPNGKVDRKALPPPSFDVLSSAETYIAPSTDVEKKLVDMWEKALGVSPIGVNDTFYELGGDSLAAISIMIKMESLGISERDCRVLFQGGTISDIAKGEPDDALSKPSNKEVSVEFRTSLLVNCLRGLLVLLVVAGHWMPGLLERLPESFEAVKTYVTPVFNFSTPGFAMVFGIGLGYSLFDAYQFKKERFYHQVKIGIGIVFIGLLIKSGSGAFVEFAEGVDVEQAFRVTRLYHVLGFYLLAMCSIVAWFKVINHQQRVMINTMILIALFMGLDYLVKLVLLDVEVSGVLQLFKLYLVAKFAYFNLAAGALTGFLVGYHLKVTLGNRNFIHNFWLGASMTVLGVLMGAITGEINQLTKPSLEINIWKWILYFGVINILIYVFWEILEIYNKLTHTLRELINILSLFGVIAFPMFVFHGVVLAIKDILDAFSVPDLIGLVGVLSMFFGATFIIIRRLYRLYF